MDRLELTGSLTHPGGQIDVTIVETDSQIWGNPGVYVIATDQTGTQIATIRVQDFRTINGERAEQRGAHLIAHALRRFYINTHDE